MADLEAGGLTRDPRDRTVDALLELAAMRPWSEIGLADIAAHAGLSLKELRASFPSKGAILGAFSRRIDLATLGGDVIELAGEPPRERVFDVLMRRFEALRPHRAALRSIRAGMAGEPLTLAALNASTVNSMQWMLAEARVSNAGLIGIAEAQALTLLYGRVLGVFLDDEDPALSRTMKALDEELRSAEPWVRRAHRLQDVLSGLLQRGLPGSRRAASAPPEQTGGASELTPPI